MALLKYFKVSKRSDNTYLPDVNGPLAKEMPSSAIAAANSSIARAMEIREQKQDTGKPRGEYRVYSGKEKAEIAKRAAVYGISATIRHYAKIDPKRVLPSSSVFDWKKQYQQEVQKRKREGEEDFEITALPCKKRGRTLLLGNVLDGRVQSFIRDMRCHGAVINTAVVMGCAEGIVSHHDSNLLAGNGGHITISKDWAKSLLHRMGYVKRRESTSAKVPPKDFDTLKAQFVYDADVLVDYGNIPDALVINWDHTGIKYIPVGSWTMEKEGQKRVQITGIDDKRQITAVFAATKTGSFLPIQVIYKGKTKRCLPSVDFPEDWLISFTENHWANETTTKDYIYKILLPYVEQKREELKLPGDHPALVVFDHFKAQCTSNILQILRDNHIDTLLIPASCTDRLQPLDVSVNKAAKEFLRRQFHLWYAGEVCHQLRQGSSIKQVDTRMSVVKPLGAKWLIKMHDYFKSNPEIIINGFRKAGL